MTLVISPLSSALLTVSPIALPTQSQFLFFLDSNQINSDKPLKDITAQSLTTLAFVPDPSFASYAAASGFALAHVVYGAGWPLFVNNDGAVEQWTISSDWGKNGSVAANTVAIKVSSCPRNLQAAES